MLRSVPQHVIIRPNDPLPPFKPSCSINSSTVAYISRTFDRTSIAAILQLSDTFACIHRPNNTGETFPRSCYRETGKKQLTKDPTSRLFDRPTDHPYVTGNSKPNLISSSVPGIKQLPCGQTGPSAHQQRWTYRIRKRKTRLQN